MDKLRSDTRITKKSMNDKERKMVKILYSFDAAPLHLNYFSGDTGIAG